jgi:CBS domain-containing protein
MTIQQIPLPPPLCISPELPATEALHLLVKHGYNHLPICTDGKLIGMLGINDLLLEVIPASAKAAGGLDDLSFAGDATGLLAGMLEKLRERTAGSLMRTFETTLQQDCPMLEAALLLSRHNSPLPVLDNQGRLRGMLSRRALLSHLLDHLE